MRIAASYSYASCFVLLDLEGCDDCLYHLFLIDDIKRIRGGQFRLFEFGLNLYWLWKLPLLLINLGSLLFVVHRSSCFAPGNHGEDGSEIPDKDPLWLQCFSCLGLRA